MNDSHTYFSKHPYQKECLNGQSTNVFYGVLSYTPKACECCDVLNQGNTIIKYSTKRSDIQPIPYQKIPTILRLYKQRFLCKKCHQTFILHTSYVASNCYISQLNKKDLQRTEERLLEKSRVKGVNVNYSE